MVAPAVPQRVVQHHSTLSLVFTIVSTNLILQDYISNHRSVRGVMTICLGIHVILLTLEEMDLLGKSTALTLTFGV